MLAVQRLALGPPVLPGAGGVRRGPCPDLGVQLRHAAPPVGEPAALGGRCACDCVIGHRHIVGGRDSRARMRRPNRTGDRPWRTSRTSASSAARASTRCSTTCARRRSTRRTARHPTACSSRPSPGGGSRSCPATAAAHDPAAQGQLPRERVGDALARRPGGDQPVRRRLAPAPRRARPLRRQRPVRRPDDGPRGHLLRRPDRVPRELRRDLRPDPPRDRARRHPRARDHRPRRRHRRRHPGPAILHQGRNRSGSATPGGRSST